jgi:hypothetical protein
MLATENKQSHASCVLRVPTADEISHGQLHNNLDLKIVKQGIKKITTDLTCSTHV